MEDEHDDGDDQDDVDEATSEVKSKATAPENQKDDGKNEKHVLKSWPAKNLAAGNNWNCRRVRPLLDANPHLFLLPLTPAEIKVLSAVRSSQPSSRLSSEHGWIPKAADP